MYGIIVALPSIHMFRPLLFCFQFEEVYTIVSAVKEVTLYSQNASEATAEGAMNHTVLLLTQTLEPTNPLVIEHVPSISEESANASASDGPPKTTRRHAELTETGRRTREAFATAIGKRFLPRYTPRGLDKHPHLFDHAMLLSPRSRKLSYINALVDSEAAKGLHLASAAEIKTRLRKEVVTLIAEAVAANRKAVAEQRAEVEPSAVRRSSAPRTVAEEDETAKRMKAAGLFDSDSDDDGDVGAAVGERSPEDEAQAMMDEWLAQKVGLAREE